MVDVVAVVVVVVVREVVVRLVDVVSESLLLLELLELLLLRFFAGIGRRKFFLSDEVECAKQQQRTRTGKNCSKRIEMQCEARKVAIDLFRLVIVRRRRGHGPCVLFG